MASSTIFLGLKKTKKFFLIREEDISSKREISGNYKELDNVKFAKTSSASSYYYFITLASCVLQTALFARLYVMQIRLFAVRPQRI